MVSDRLFDRACNDLQAQTKKVLELEQMNTALRARVVELEEALDELLDYTRACEGLLNASESGACVKARRALEEK